MSLASPSGGGQTDSQADITKSQAYTSGEGSPPFLPPVSPEESRAFWPIPSVE